MKFIKVLLGCFLCVVFSSAALASTDDVKAKKVKESKASKNLLCKLMPTLCIFSTRGNGGGSEPPVIGKGKGGEPSTLSNGGGSEPPKR